MTILVDFDDTLVDLLKPWCEVLNKKAHTKVKPEDIKSWDICSYFPTLTCKEIFEPLDKPSMWKKVQIKLNADKVLKKLIDDGHDVYIVTATHYNNIKLKYEYVVKKYFPFIDWDHFIVTSNKSMIKGDILIDDGLHNLTNDHTNILFSSYNNKDYPDGTIVAYGWYEVYAIILELFMEAQLKEF